MARYFVVGGVDTLWSTIGNWSLTSGGAGGQTVPTAAEDVILDGNSGTNCTLNTSARVCKTLLIDSGFTGGDTLQMDQQLSVSGSITFTGAPTITGTATNKLRMIAAGTWTSNGYTYNHDLEIGGTTTFIPTIADLLRTTQNMLLSNTTSTPFAGAGGITVDGNCTVSGSQTVTPANNQVITIGGTTTVSDACVFTAQGTSSWTTAGLTTTGATTGTQKFTLSGGTLQGAAALSNSVDVAGNLTLSGTILYAASGTPTFTWLSGTVTQGSSIFSIGSSCTLNTAGMSFFDVKITAAATITNNSLLTATGTLTHPDAAVTWGGTAGFTVANRTNTAIIASRTDTYTAGNTYTVTNSLVSVLGSGETSTTRYTWISSHGTNKVTFILGPGATQDLLWVDPTRIDSSAGQPIFTCRGTITTCFNWTATTPIVRTAPQVMIGI